MCGFLLGRGVSIKMGGSLLRWGGFLLRSGILMKVGVFYEDEGNHIKNGIFC